MTGGDLERLIVIIDASNRTASTTTKPKQRHVWHVHRMHTICVYTTGLPMSTSNTAIVTSLMFEKQSRDLCLNVEIVI